MGVILFLDLSATRVSMIDNQIVQIGIDLRKATPDVRGGFEF